MEKLKYSNYILGQYNLTNNDIYIALNTIVENQHEIHKALEEIKAAKQPPAAQDELCNSG